MLYLIRSDVYKRQILCAYERNARRGVRSILCKLCSAEISGTQNQSTENRAGYFFAAGAVFFKQSAVDNEWLLLQLSLIHI